MAKFKKGDWVTFNEREIRDQKAVGWDEVSYIKDTYFSYLDKRFYFGAIYEIEKVDGFLVDIGNDNETIGWHYAYFNHANGVDIARWKLKSK